ncbi:DUF308 domain-containing protein [Methanobacterium alcaliphilum]|uniref:DUF308 domain-containing protein n=1 Tax=Methanobacterium alcaliphilum TaxID=392018 RepID=UPI002009F7BD|nr:DUF308 domain-containing protein [Methanobacterium alcaliphilum]MCK9151010.1 DUF308 domain-containing protein [Methanobacterium alcaliphilum]
MVTKKPDKNNKGDEKSKSSVFGLVKSMADKLDPDLETDDQNDKLNDPSKSDVRVKPEKESTKTKTDSKSQDDDSDKSSTYNLKLKFRELSKLLQEDRERVLKILGVIIAGFFIITGIFLILGSADKVSDNVIFGERAVTSAFFVIIGILILAGVFAQNIMKKTSFDNIYNQVKVAEEDPSSKSEDDSSSGKEKKEKN